MKNDTQATSNVMRFVTHDVANKRVALGSVLRHASECGSKEVHENKADTARIKRFDQFAIS
jgi:hypothetical protein